MLALASMTGCAVGGSQAQTTETGAKNHLTCPSEVRGSATFDEFPTQTYQQPEAAVAMFVDSSAGEATRVTRHLGAHRGDATVVILRPDGTPRARVSLQLGNEGWSRYTSTTCGDDSLVR
jgi:hypothetical protein